MSDKPDHFHFSLSFDSGQTPPPANYECVLEGDFKGRHHCHLKLEMVFHYREGLNEEEILSEGFTLDDDYCFEADLSSNLSAALFDFIANPLFENSKNEMGKSAHIKTDFKAEDLPVEATEHFIQELFQAFLEYEQLEETWKIDAFIVSQFEKLDFRMTVSFWNRDINIYPTRKGLKTIQWKALHDIFRIAEHEEPITLKKAMKKEGIYFFFQEAIFRLR